MSSRFLQHAMVAYLALYWAYYGPGRLALCLLATSAANAILGFQPESRSPYKWLHLVPYPLLSRAGRSVEIACYLVQITTRFGMLVLGLWLLLLGAIALHRYLPLRDAPYSIWREYIGDSLLWGAYGAVEVAWVMQVLWALWAVTPTAWFRSASLWIAPFVAILIVLAFLYDPMCALQDRISERRIRRARGVDGNTRNAAACLPAEVQLLIFDLVRTSALFGAHEHLPSDTRSCYPNRMVAFSASYELTKAARVCAAWRGPATEVLYRDAVLRSSTAVCKLSRTLAQLPDLARFVRRIVLPEFEDYAPPSDKNMEDMYSIPWPEFSAAIERVVSCCVDAVDIELFRERPLLLDDTPGLRSASTNVSHLALHCKLGYGEGWQSDYEPDAIDLLVLLSLFPHLSSLSLTRQTLLFESTSLQKTHRRALSGIKELCLGACKTDFKTLERLLRHLPNLRVAELRHPEFSGAATEHIALSKLFSSQLSTLVDLRIRLDRVAASFSLHALSALRSLTVVASMLPTLTSLPPGLEVLHISFAPYSYEVKDLDACRTTLLASVHALRTLAPGLRGVHLWDDVRRAQVENWAVASTMLRAMLAPAGVDVVVDLRIGYTDVRALKETLGRRKALRRILWTGVF